MFSYSVMSDSLRPHRLQHTTTGFHVLHYLPESAQIHVHRISDASNHLILCLPLFLLPLIFAGIRVFSSELALHNKLPKYWNFSFSIRPSNEYSGLNSNLLLWQVDCLPLALPGKPGEYSESCHAWLFVTLWTVAYQAPPSMGFSKQEYWSRLPIVGIS